MTTLIFGMFLSVVAMAADSAKGINEIVVSYEVRAIQTSDREYLDSECRYAYQQLLRHETLRGRPAKTQSLLCFKDVNQGHYVLDLLNSGRSETRYLIEYFDSGHTDYRSAWSPLKPHTLTHLGVVEGEAVRKHMGFFREKIQAEAIKQMLENQRYGTVYFIEQWTEDFPAQEG